jgi:DNA-binding XRE family transcriptional regulator
MSEQNLAPRPRPGRASLRHAAGKREMSEFLRATRAKRPQYARKNPARVTNRVLEWRLARATLTPVPTPTAETAKQRHTRTTAHHLRRIREARGLTQEAVAKLVGARRVQVVKWESGKDHEPNAENLEKLCAALEIDEYELRAPVPEDES